LIWSFNVLIGYVVTTSSLSVKWKFSGTHGFQAQENST
jgi:hypothetical protein